MNNVDLLSLYYKNSIFTFNDRKVSSEKIGKELISFIDSDLFYEHEGKIFKILLSLDKAYHYSKNGWGFGFFINDFWDINQEGDTFYLALCVLFSSNFFLHNASDDEIIGHLRMVRSVTEHYCKKISGTDRFLNCSGSLHPLGYFLNAMIILCDNKIRWEFNSKSDDLIKELFVFFNFNANLLKQYFGFLNPSNKSNSELLKRICIFDIKVRGLQYEKDAIKAFRKNINSNWFKSMGGSILLNGGVIKFPKKTPKSFMRFNTYLVNNAGDGINRANVDSKKGNINTGIDKYLDIILMMKNNIDEAFLDGGSFVADDLKLKESLLKIVDIIQNFIDVAKNKDNNVNFASDVFDLHDFNYIVKESPNFVMEIIKVRKNLVLKQKLIGTTSEKNDEFTSECYNYMFNYISKLEKNIGVAKSNVLNYIESETVKKLTISVNVLENKAIIKDELQKRMLEKNKKNLSRPRIIR